MMINRLVMLMSALIIGGATWHIQLSDSVIDIFVKGHNDIRGQRDITPLKWNSTLSTNAENIVVECLYLNASQYGQNAAFVRSNHVKTEEEGKGRYSNTSDKINQRIAQLAIDVWSSEARNVDEDWKCIKQMTCAHFSQMVWEDTTDIGCAIFRCPFYEQLIICDYSPRGNILGTDPY